MRAQTGRPRLFVEIGKERESVGARAENNVNSAEYQKQATNYRTGITGNKNSESQRNQRGLETAAELVEFRAPSNPVDPNRRVLDSISG
jgi:hypothetical protein